MTPDQMILTIQLVVILFQLMVLAGQLWLSYRQYNALRFANSSQCYLAFTNTVQSPEARNARRVIFMDLSALGFSQWTQANKDDAALLKPY
jgi:hypothetical protein